MADMILPQAMLCDIEGVPYKRSGATIQVKEGHKTKAQQQPPEGPADHGTKVTWQHPGVPNKQGCG